MGYGEGRADGEGGLMVMAWRERRGEVDGEKGAG